MPYFSMAFFQACTSVSIEMPMNSIPNWWYFSYMRTTSGASLRQSGHHEAQKSSTTVLPLAYFDNWIVLPSGVFILKSGAVVPAFTSSVAYLSSMSGWANCAFVAVAPIMSSTSDRIIPLFISMFRFFAKIVIIPK